MRRPPRSAVVALALLCGAPGLAAQRPTVSPVLARADTTVAVWLFAHAGRDLASVRDLVVASGGAVRRTSRWLHAVSATMPPAALEAATASPTLRHIQPVMRFRRVAVDPPTAAPAAPGAAVDSVFGPSGSVLRFLNAFPLIERGLRGGGVRIALLDTGFETGLAPFAGANVVDQYDFVFNDTIVRDQAGDQSGASTHGTAVWSLLAADVPDTLIGLAPDAEYLLAKTEDIRSETPVEEDNFVAALEWADSLGAHIVSSSLGYLTFDGGSGYTFDQLNGDIAVTTVAADMAAERGMTVVIAMGNAGPASRTIVTPADGDSVIAVGAVDTLGTLAGFSGRGPTADGRVKPDVVAPGVAVWVRTPSGFSRLNGTSLSAPLIAGLAILLREAHPTFGPVDIADALRLHGNNAAMPDTLRGWGVPDAFLAGVFPRGLAVVRPPDSVLTSVAPTLVWRADDIAAFAQPATFRVRAGPDSTMIAPRVDTTVATTDLPLPYILRPAERLFVMVIATAADSATLTASSGAALIGPAWATLQNLNVPGGVTLRQLRPTFQWSAPPTPVSSGGFVFRVRVIRETDEAVEIVSDSLTESVWTPPRDLERNTPYRWSVTAHLDGDSSTIQSAGPFVIVDDTAPPVTTLFQNFPNPFPNQAIGRTSTCLWFDLASEGVVQLDILDMRGLTLRRLIPVGGLGPFLRAGRYGRASEVDDGSCDPRFTWDGRTDGGAMVQAGVYLARLRTPEGIFVRRIVFLGAP